jgi:streptomycin 6-kinase
MIVVPSEFAATTIAREGDAGRTWIAALPRLVADLCERWGLVIDGPPLHGYLGIVAPVLRGKERAVLKVSWADESTAGEADALRLWNGRGAVRLLESEPAEAALLLERLDHRRTLASVDIEQAAAIAGRLLRRLAVPAQGRFRSQDVVAAELARMLPSRWERYGASMPRSVLDRTLDALLRAGPASTSVLVNYDLTYDDVLGGRREPWLAVDPKVVIGNPEFGAAQLLWTRLEEIEAAGGLDRHFRTLCEAAELDEGLAHLWALVRCVDYWLWAVSAGLTTDPARCGIIVEWLLKTPPGRG